MAARRYDRNFSSSVEKSFTNEGSEQVKYFSTQEETFSPRDHVMFYLLYKHNEIPNHFTLILFWCERRDLLCSLSNGDIFTHEDIMFSCKSSPGICLYNNTINYFFCVCLLYLIMVIQSYIVNREK